MRRTATVQEDALSPDEARELAGLVAAADLPAGASEQGERAMTASPDAFHYRLTVEVGGRKYSLQLSDTDMPARLRPLINWLTKRASAGGASTS
jgi:hypothetical protein